MPNRWRHLTTSFPFSSGEFEIMPSRRDDLTRRIIAVLFIVSLIAASFWIIRPFLPATVWAVTHDNATWPLMMQVQRYTGNRRGIAVLIMTGGLLVILVMPLWMAISTIMGRLDVIEDLFRRVLSFRVPPAPEWLGSVPLIGDQLIKDWRVIRDVGVPDLAPKLTPYAGELTRWLTSAVGGLGGTLLQFFLIIAISAILYAKGEIAADAATRVDFR
jgi:predicted PurR-regulated permease PerM